MKNSNKDRNSEKQIWQYLVGALLGLLALSLGLVAIAAKYTHLDLPTYLTSYTHKTITVQDLQQGQLKPIILIDVRSPQEHQADYIAGSKLVPIDEIETGNGIQQVQKIINANLRSGQPQPMVVLYCKAGPRSHRAYAKLTQAVNFNFVVLKGGIIAWREVVNASADAKVLGL